MDINYADQEEGGENNQRYIGDLIHENFYDELVIIGFPFDQGAKQLQLRAGSFLGPDSFRRFLSHTNFGVVNNVEKDINIAEYLPKISDYGNIATEQVNNGRDAI